MLAKDSGSKQEQVGEALIKAGIVTTAQLSAASEESARGLKSLLRALVDQGALSETAKLRFLRDFCRVDVVSLRDVMPRPEVSDYISPAQCRRLRVVPLRIDGGKLLVAMEDPTDVSALAGIEAASQLGVKPVLATSEDIDLAIGRMPDIESGSSSEAPAAPGWVRATVLLSFSLLPMAGFYYYMFLSDARKEFAFLMELDAFGRILFLLLACTMWASVAFAIVDMAFGRKSTRDAR